MRIPILLLALGASQARAQRVTPLIALDSAPLARRALTSPSVSWRHIATPYAELYVKQHSRAEAVIPVLAARVTDAITRDLAILGEGAPDRRMRLFFVGSRAEMTPFTGGTEGGGAVAPEASAIFVANDSIFPQLRHEIMHVLSWRLWGNPSSTWISEGIATYAMKQCGGYEIDDIAAALLAEKRFVPLDTLRHAFTVKRETGAIHYIESASLTQFILRHFGRDTLRSLWRTPQGLAHSRELLGRDVGALEKEWRAEIETRHPPASWAELWRAIDARGCE